MGLFGIPTRKEREFRAQQINNCRRIFTESMKIMMSTDNIETFMSRYRTAREAIYEAGRVAGERSKCMNGVSPKEALTILDRDLPQVLTPCIDRFMQKQTIRISNLSRGKISKAKGLYLLISEYEDEMPSECIEHWKWLVDKLITKIERLENMNKTEGRKASLSPKD